jgi:hypothetical protein
MSRVRGIHQKVTYLGWRRKLLDLLIEDSLDMFTCLSNHMIRAIERDTIAEHQPHVRDELLGAVIALNVGTGLWLGGI